MRSTFHRGQWVSACPCGAPLFPDDDSEFYVLSENAVHELICSACARLQNDQHWDAANREFLALIERERVERAIGNLRRVAKSKGRQPSSQRPSA